MKSRPKMKTITIIMVHEHKRGLSRKESAGEER
jgi:hypothetical protein